MSDDRVSVERIHVQAALRLVAQADAEVDRMVARVCAGGADAETRELAQGVAEARHDELGELNRGLLAALAPAPARVTVEVPVPVVRAPELTLHRLCGRMSYKPGFGCQAGC